MQGQAPQGAKQQMMSMMHHKPIQPRCLQLAAQPVTGTAEVLGSPIGSGRLGNGPIRNALRGRFLDGTSARVWWASLPGRTPPQTQRIPGNALGGRFFDGHRHTRFPKCLVRHPAVPFSVAFWSALLRDREQRIGWKAGQRAGSRRSQAGVAGCVDEIHMAEVGLGRRRLRRETGRLDRGIQSQG